MSEKKTKEHLTLRKKHMREKDDVTVEGFISFWESYIRLPFIGLVIMGLSVLFFRFNYLLLDMLDTFSFNPSILLYNYSRAICYWMFILGGMLFIKGIYNLFKYNH